MLNLIEQALEQVKLYLTIMNNLLDQQHPCILNGIRKLNSFSNCNPIIHHFKRFLVRENNIASCMFR